MTITFKLLSFCSNLCLQHKKSFSRHYQHQYQDLKSSFLNLFCQLIAIEAHCYYVIIWAMFPFWKLIPCLVLVKNGNYLKKVTEDCSKN